MHRLIRDGLEDVLAGTPGAAQAGHLKECGECRKEVAAMRGQAALLRQLRAPDLEESEPRPGFYARVLERIEAQNAGSIWNLFFDSLFGRRIALASAILILLLGVYLVSAERMAEPEPILADIPFEVLPGPVIPVSAALEGAVPQDDVLVNLVTYREQ